MSCPTRDEILERIATLLGSRLVRWSDARTSRGDFEGSQWTIDVFDVPGEESFELGRRIAAYRRELSREYGIGLVVVPHTPEATDRHFPWVGSQGRGRQLWALDVRHLRNNRSLERAVCAPAHNR